MSWSVVGNAMMAVEFATTNSSDDSSSVLTEGHHDDGRPKAPQINAYKTLRYYIQQLTADSAKIFGITGGLIAPSNTSSSSSKQAAKPGGDGSNGDGVTEHLLSEKATPNNAAAKAKIGHEMLRLLAKYASTSAVQLTKHPQIVENMLVVLRAVVLHLNDENNTLFTADQVGSLVSSTTKITLLGHDPSPTSQPPTPSGQPSLTQGPLKLIAADVRIAALSVIAMLAHRHADLMLPHWNTLFPDLDPSKVTSRHPLFTPMLHDKLNFARSAAAAALNHIIAKTSAKVQLATEPSATSRGSARQSFTSMSMVVGRVILAAHEALLFGICHEKWPKKMRIMYLPTFAAISGVTPYDKLSRSSEVLLSFMRNTRVHDELFGLGRNEGQVLCSSLAAIWRNKSTIPVLSPFLVISERQNHQQQQQVSALLNHVFGLLPDVEAWKAVHALAKNFSVAVKPRWKKAIATATSLLNKGRHTTDANSQGNDPSSTPQKKSPTKTQQQKIFPKDREILIEMLRACVAYFGPTYTTYPKWRELTYTATERKLHGSNADAKLYVKDVLIPALNFLADDVRCEAYTCLGQLDDSYFKIVPQDHRLALVSAILDNGVMEESPICRANALETIGSWAWTHPSLTIEFYHDFAQTSVNALYSEVDTAVVPKAAFAVGNLSAKLTSTFSAQEHPLPIGDVALLATGASIAMRKKLNASSASTTPQQTPAKGQQSTPPPTTAGLSPAEVATRLHGLRAFGQILAALPEEDLIFEIDGHPDGVGTAGLEYFAEFARDPHFSIRCNAVTSAGCALARREVFMCDPESGAAAVKGVLSCISTDKHFKVKARAAMALRYIHHETLATRIPQCLAACFDALKLDAQNFTQFKDSQWMKDEVVKTMRFLFSNICGIPCETLVDVSTLVQTDAGIDELPPDAITATSSTTKTEDAPAVASSWAAKLQAIRADPPTAVKTPSSQHVQQTTSAAKLLAANDNAIIAPTATMQQQQQQYITEPAKPRHSAVTAEGAEKVEEMVNMHIEVLENFGLLRRGPRFPGVKKQTIEDETNNGDAKEVEEEEESVGGGSDEAFIVCEREIPTDKTKDERKHVDPTTAPSTNATAKKKSNGAAASSTVPSNNTKTTVKSGGVKKKNKK